MGSICTAMNPVLWTGAPERAAVKRQPMDQAPDCLDRDRRAAVLDALCEVCFDRGWSLWAAHLRTNHVHVVVEAGVVPRKP